MDQIRKQARIAQRRLTTQRFLKYLPWTLSIAFMVAFLGASVPKLTLIEIDTNLWFFSWLGGTALIALLVNGYLAFAGRPTLGDSAAEIDRRFALRERLSSALFLSPEDRETELGQALTQDALRNAEKIDVRDRFRWGFHRQLMLPLVPAIVIGLLWILPDFVNNKVNANPNAPTLTQVKNSTKPLLEELKKKREQAEKDGLTAAVDIFKKLEGELAKLQKDTKLDTKQTLAKLNDIKEQLSERRKELGSAESLKKNLQNLEKFENGPAEKLADALQKGDFEKAEQSLEELMKQMKNGELSQAEMQKLQQQLEKLEQAMSQAAQSHEQAKQALREQVAQAEASGDLQKAAQLQRKLEQMQAQDANMAQMQQMADMLSQAQQSMKQGDMQAAQEAMEQMASQLQQMNQSDSELQDLDQLMDSLAQSKSQMMCDKCNGAGCASCMMGQMPGQIPGQGMGEGNGAGDRPEEETDINLVDSQVRSQMKQGETVYGGKVGGDNRKGTTQVEVQDAVLTALSEEPEPLDNTPLPKSQRDHTREYFNSIREGK